MTKQIIIILFLAPAQEKPSRSPFSFHFVMKRQLEALEANSLHDQTAFPRSVEIELKGLKNLNKHRQSQH